MRYPPRVTVVEVGPRDGLQNEAAEVSTADKVAFVDRLSDAGLPGDRGLRLRQPEVGAANGGRRRSVRRDPQAAGSPVHCPGTESSPGSSAPWRRMSREVAIFAAASETFSLRNINQTIEQSMAGYQNVCARARAGRRPRPRDICPPRSVARTKVPLPSRGSSSSPRALIAMGAFEVAVSDTIGIAHPGQVVEVVGALALRSRSNARAALPRHAGHGAGKRARGPRPRRRDVRRVGRRTRAAARTRRERQETWPRKI